MAEVLLESHRQAFARVLERVLEGIETRVRAGEREVVRALAAVSREPTFARFVVEGAGELWLRADREAVRVLDPGSTPAADGFGHAVGVDARSVEHVLGQLNSGSLAGDELLLLVAAMASERAHQLFAQTRFGFAFELTGIAGLGTVRVRVALGRPELGATEFVLRLGAKALEDAIEEGIAPHRLFLDGKVEIDGDVAKALVLGMTLSELTQA